MLGEEQAGIEAVELLEPEPGHGDWLHVERRLQRLPQLLAGHGAGLVVQHGHRPAARLDDARLDLWQRLDALVGVLLHEHRVVILAGFHPGQPHGRLGHGHEQDLVDVRRLSAAEAVGRLRPRRVVLEADELDVAVGLVLDEPVGAGADELLERTVAGRLDDFPGIDRRVRLGQPEQERARRLLEMDDDRGRIPGLDALDALPEDLADGRHLTPALERGHHVGRGHLLAVVELQAAP